MVESNSVTGFADHRIPCPALPCPSLPMSSPPKPVLAVTMGDATGIGPEVVVGAWPDVRIHECVRPFVVGHPEILRRAARLLRRSVAVVEAYYRASFGGAVPAEADLAQMTSRLASL